MNKRWIFLIVVIVAFFAVRGALAKGAQAAGGIDLPRLAVQYDGYSDGLGLAASGSYVNGEECGSTTNAVWGTKHYLWGVAQVMHDPYGSTADLQTVLTYDGRWGHFGPDGLVNQGTWSPGCPGRNPNLPASADPESAAPAPAAETVMTIDIGFDGFCDGMSVTVSGSSRDVAYAAVGTACGCADYELFGSRYAKRTTLQATADSGYEGILYAIDDNHGYRIFSSAGLAAIGTWSWGCPAAAAASLPSLFDQAAGSSKR